MDAVVVVPADPGRRGELAVGVCVLLFEGGVDGLGRGVVVGVAIVWGLARFPGRAKWIIASLVGALGPASFERLGGACPDVSRLTPKVGVILATSINTRSLTADFPVGAPLTVWITGQTSAPHVEQCANHRTAPTSPARGVNIELQRYSRGLPTSQVPSRRRQAPSLHAARTICRG